MKMAFDFFKKKETEIKVVEGRKFEREDLKEFFSKKAADSNSWSGAKKSFQELEEIDKDKKVINEIKKVKDPELDVDIWTLGLIYDMTIEIKKVNITMTFTSPMCPYGEQIVKNLKSGLNNIGFEANVKIVFNPIWQPSEELKEILGFQ